ncbi:Spy0128 family protein [Bifidobacterium eulemuris]|uniref:Cna B-type domain-containing protein n=1 Tax=Bifidobacterium eulemuris TaxID=1765219 RepID=A0A261GDR6_9BIFI|nr:FctA domain-containing protein [Bifidobacterium eulemuris]OZG69582.1 VWA domain-containing protein [Bifidobacterium eulemuris]QOL32125.1 Cna B-type domain-containing protein [Bifidobacterium eulemuris]
MTDNTDNDVPYVAFTNDYDTKPIDVVVNKQWEGVSKDEQVPVIVQLEWTGGENGHGVQATFELNADNNWTTTISGLPSATTTHGRITYTVVETKVKVGSSYKTLDESGFEAKYAYSEKAGTYTYTVTNSKKYVELDASTITVKKTVVGKAAQSDFKFTLTASGNNKDSVIWPEDSGQSLTATVSKDALSNLTEGQASANTTFLGTLRFPASDGVYTFDVKENSGDALTGWVYDTDTVIVTVTVTKGEAAVSYGYADGDADSATRDAAAFTNRYVAVSSLPLTGGPSERDWLIGGAGLGLLALLLIGGAGIWRGKQRLL